MHNLSHYYYVAEREKDGNIYFTNNVEDKELSYFTGFSFTDISKKINSLDSDIIVVLINDI